MHGWAETVEAFSAQARMNLKQDGTYVIQRYMSALADLLHAREYSLETVKVTHSNYFVGESQKLIEQALSFH